MSVELVTALAGALVGAALTGVLGYFQSRWAWGMQSRLERERGRIALVREIMRHRLDQQSLVGPLNEIPLVFGDDTDVMRLYRETLNAVDTSTRARSLTDLINRLAALVNLPSNVQGSDIQRGFSFVD